MIRDVSTSTLLTSRDRINCLAARSTCDRRAAPLPCKCTNVGLHLVPESTFVSRPCLSCCQWSSRGGYVGPPTAFPVRAPVCRGCPCRDPPVCHRVQGDSVAKRHPLLCVCWSRDLVCALRSCSWSCITLLCNWEYLHSCSTGSAVQALSRRHSQSFINISNFSAGCGCSLQLVILLKISSK